MTREEAIKGLKVLAKDFSGYRPNEEMFNMAIEALEQLPSAQPERPKGEWVNDIAYYDEDGCPCVVTRCNQCGEVSEAFNFCPNCGADMRGEEDE